jgi:hypothetical protein
MANRPALAKQAEITRCVKGVTAAGLDVGKVVVGRDGSITVFPKGAVSVPTANPWDDAE